MNGLMKRGRSARRGSHHRLGPFNPAEASALISTCRHFEWHLLESATPVYLRALNLHPLRQQLVAIARNSRTRDSGVRNDASKRGASVSASNGIYSGASDGSLVRCIAGNGNGLIIMYAWFHDQ